MVYDVGAVIEVYDVFDIDRACDLSDNVLQIGVYDGNMYLMHMC